MEETRDVLVIGAGLAGLAAGIGAAANGYSVLVLEKHSVPGGVIATWKRGEWTIEGGMHFLMGGAPGSPLEALYRGMGILPGLDLATLDPYMEFHDEASGTRVELGGDLDALEARLVALSPADRGLVRGLVRGARAMVGSDFGLGALEQAPGLGGLGGSFKMAWAMRRYARYYAGRYGSSMRDYAARASSPLLAKVLLNLFLPEVPVWFAMMLLALAASGQLGLLRAGSLDFAQRMAARLEGLGGRLEYRASVEEVLVEGGRAVGVRLEGGRELRTGAVIAAGDLHDLHFRLLGGRYLDAATRERFDSWPLVRPFLMASFGVERSFEGEPAFSVEVLEKPLVAAGETFSLASIRRFNYTDRFAPAGSSVIQILFETDWERWKDLHGDRVAYGAAKAGVGAAALALLERLYPGIGELVRQSDVATPWTLYRYTQNWKGAYEGWLPTPGNILKTIPRSIPGLERLWLAGQWVSPGGGVPVSMYTGLHAVQLLCASEGRRYRAPD